MVCAHHQISIFGGSTFFFFCHSCSRTSSLSDTPTKTTTHNYIWRQPSTNQQQPFHQEQVQQDPTPTMNIRIGSYDNSHFRNPLGTFFYRFSLSTNEHLQERRTSEMGATMTAAFRTTNISIGSYDDSGFQNPLGMEPTTRVLYQCQRFKHTIRW